MTDKMKGTNFNRLSDDVDIIRSSPESLQTKIKKTHVHRTIAKTPVLKNHFPKLSLKKNMNSCPPKPLMTGKEKLEQLENIENKKKLYNLSPICNNLYVDTPPFVTKKRPVPRNISSFLFNSGTDNSCNNSSETETKLSESKLFENIMPKTHSTPTIEEKTEISTYRVVNQSINRSNVSSETPKRSDSNIDQEMANLMDNIYGEVWRSTPGLFKKKKPDKPREVDVIDELLNKISNINLSKNECKDVSNDSIKSNDVNRKNCSNDSVILLSDTSDYLNDHDFQNKRKEKESVNENLCEDVNKNEPSVLKSYNHDIFQISGSKDKNALNFESGRLQSNYFNDKKEISLKPSKLDFSDKPKDIFNDKENTNIPITKKVLKKKENETSKKKIPTEKPSNIENIEQYSFMASLSDNVPTWRMEYKAKHYKDNFKTKKEDLAKILFKTFNENVFDSKLSPDLPIIWSQTLNKTAGRAHNKTVKFKKGTDGTPYRSAHIELSVKVLDSAHRLRNTLAHEMCHVAAWIIDGKHDGHGPYWKSWINKILRRYPEIGNLSVCHSYDIHFKYSYKCTKCGYKINRHSKSIDTDKKRCGYCYGTFECILNKKTKDGLVVSTPSKQRKVVNGFALYVKENYSNVRSGNTPHKDVMKYLGNQYSKLKSQSRDGDN